jgi:hypothetical protein
VAVTAPAPSPAAPTSAPASSKRLPLVRRVLLGVSGLAMLVGFFLPWLKVGTLLTISGFGLVFATGDVVNVISGASRFMLVVVPLLGFLLVLGALLGYRLTQWVALAGATAILGFGLARVLELFVTSTGLGMWLVIFSALSCLIVSLLTVGQRLRG